MHGTSPTPIGSTTSHLRETDVPSHAIDLDFLDDDWFEAMLSGQPPCCGMGCGAMRPEYYGQPANVRVTRAPRGVFDSAPTALIIHRDLRHLVEPHLPHSIFGRCIAAGSDTPIDSHVTVYTPRDHTAIIRGAPGTKYSRCGKCGIIQIRRVSKISEDCFVDASSIDPHAKVAQPGGHGNLLVSDRIRELLQDRFGTMLEFIETPVAVFER